MSTGGFNIIRFFITTNFMLFATICVGHDNAGLASKVAVQEQVLFQSLHDESLPLSETEKSIEDLLSAFSSQAESKIKILQIRFIEKLYATENVASRMSLKIKVKICDSMNGIPHFLLHSDYTDEEKELIARKHVDVLAATRDQLKNERKSLSPWQPVYRHSGISFPPQSEKILAEHREEMKVRSENNQLIRDLSELDKTFDQKFLKLLPEYLLFIPDADVIIKEITRSYPLSEAEFKSIKNGLEKLKKVTSREK